LARREIKLAASIDDHRDDRGRAGGLFGEGSRGTTTSRLRTGIHRGTDGE
jgi:hypothetical protein